MITMIFFKKLLAKEKRSQAVSSPINPEVSPNKKPCMSKTVPVSSKTACNVSPFAECQPKEVDSKHFSSLLFVEVFAGTGGLTANIRALGIQGVGIDSSVSTSCKCPIVKLDLTKESGQTLLWEILRRPNVWRRAPSANHVARRHAHVKYQGLKDQIRCRLGQKLFLTGCLLSRVLITRECLALTVSIV